MDNNSIKSPEHSITVPEIRRSRGFHKIAVSETDADAIFRFDKTAVGVDAINHINKGDWIVFGVFRDSSLTKKTFNYVEHFVFEVSYVSDIAGCSPHMNIVCFAQKDKFFFHEGDVNGEYKEDTVTFQS